MRNRADGAAALRSDPPMTTVHEMVERLMINVVDHLIDLSRTLWRSSE